MAPLRESRWRSELEAARTDKDVLNVARDYVALLGSSELHTLPNELKPIQITSCAEISDWALRLVQASLSLHPDVAGTMLQEMSEFFASASARLSELHARPRR
jgi:hypothetical protein